jgi:hypothetical protein
MQPRKSDSDTRFFTFYVRWQKLLDSVVVESLKYFRILINIHWDIRLQRFFPMSNAAENSEIPINLPGNFFPKIANILAN